MNSHIKTFSLLAGALLLIGGVYYLQGCHKEPPIGDEGADVTKLQNSNSSAQPVSVPMSPPPATATPEVIVAAKPSPSKEKTAVAAQQGQQAFRTDDYVAARSRIEVIEGARKSSVDFRDQIWADTVVRLNRVTTPPAPEPSTLIAEASALLNEQRPKQALTVVDRALEIIKAQPAPDDAEQNKEYLDTKRDALAVRAKALSTLASTYEPGRLGEAETAYSEYLAVESDPLRRSVAENELASMLYERGQWAKARVIYQRMLASNPKNQIALERLAGIRRAVAKEQQSAGRTTEAETSSDAAADYSERLRDLRRPTEPTRRPPVTRANMPAAKSVGEKRVESKAGRKIP
jgi:tetratricopeptide (TPR) repeat protein